MLILTRRIQEAIKIEDNVTITVLSIKDNQVRLGIDAPLDIKVHREEIYHRIKRNENTLKPEAKTSENILGRINHTL